MPPPPATALKRPHHHKPRTPPLIPSLPDGDKDAEGIAAQPNPLFQAFQPATPAKRGRIVCDYLPTPPPSVEYPHVGYREAVPTPPLPVRPRGSRLPPTLQDLTPPLFQNLLHSNTEFVIRCINIDEFLHWKSQNKQLLEDVWSRWEFNARDLSFIVKCMTSPMHERFMSYASTIFNKSINKITGNDAFYTGVQFLTNLSRFYGHLLFPVHT